MPSNNSKTVVIPLRLGPVSKVNRRLFSLFRMKDAIRDGNLFLEATLDEIVQIRQMVEVRNEYDHLFENAKNQYDELMGQKEELETRKALMNPWKILELLSMAKETHLFVVAGHELYHSTRTTSEKMRRRLLSVPSVNIIPAEESVSLDEEVAGIAIPLSGDLDDDTSTIISSLFSDMDPFADPQSSADGSDNTSDGFVEVSRESDDTSHLGTSPVVNLTYIHNYHRLTSTLSGFNLRDTSATAVSVTTGDLGNVGSGSINILFRYACFTCRFTGMTHHHENLPVDSES
ncbi:hypothetical protein J3A83DRAFT_4230980 [Scleroderma citrinum]